MDIKEKVQVIKEEESEKDKKRIVVLILAVLTVLVALIGASFAYFTKVVNSTKGNQSIVLGTTTLEGVTFKASDNISLTNALPGDKTSSTFTITNPNSSAKVRYSLKMIADLNEFTARDGVGQVLLKVWGGDLKEPVILDFTDGENVKEGTIITNIELHAKESDAYNIELEFAETNTNQNENISKNFAAHIEITQSIVVES